jgi:hypothetical protein
MFISDKDIAEFTFGYDCKDNLVYLFGGSSVYDGYFNNLSNRPFAVLSLTLERHCK